jgi:sec-independent protein translocase protein TatC
MPRTPRTVSHEDRLSLVEHLTELRARIVICLLALMATTVLCMWQNQRALHVLNQPLTQTVGRGTTDPIMQGARWDQHVAGWLKDDAALARRAATAVDDAQLRAGMLAHAARGERIATLAPEVHAQAGHARSV